MACLENDCVGATSPLTNSSPDITRGHSIHDLASEILGEIFIHCLPYPSNPTSYKDAPLLLLQVCRHWRQTACGTPHLWTDLTLTYNFSIPLTEVFRTWLDNAGSLPLKVFLPGLSINPEEVRQCKDVLALLQDNFDRISELQGGLACSFPTLLAGRTLPFQAPFLKRLDIHTMGSLTSSDLEFTRRSLIAPQLEVCFLNNSRFLLSQLSLDPARLIELHRLWITGAAEFESMEILTSFTSLRVLSIAHHPRPNFPIIEFPSIIPIPSLRHLDIQVYSDNDPNEFLKALDVPFIEHLRLRSESTDSPPPRLGPLLEDLMSNSTPPLKKLTLIGFDITASEDMPSIRRFTQLVELGLQHGTIEAEALISLTWDSSTSPDLWICPVLSILHLEYIRLPWKEMEDLIRSRVPASKAGRGLREVNLLVPGEGLEESHRAAMRMIQEDSGGLIQTHLSVF